MKEEKEEKKDKRIEVVESASGEKTVRAAHVPVPTQVIKPFIFIHTALLFLKFYVPRHEGVCFFKKKRCKKCLKIDKVDLLHSQFRPIR